MIERGGDGGVHEETARHDQQKHAIDMPSAPLENGGLEAGVRPDAKDCDRQNHRLGHTAPCQRPQKMMAQLGNSEDKDQIEKQLQRSYFVAAVGLGWPLAGDRAPGKYRQVAPRSRVKVRNKEGAPGGSSR